MFPCTRWLKVAVIAALLAFLGLGSEATSRIAAAHKGAPSHSKSTARPKTPKPKKSSAKKHSAKPHKAKKPKKSKPVTPSSSGKKKPGKSTAQKRPMSTGAKTSKKSTSKPHSRHHSSNSVHNSYSYESHTAVYRHAPGGPSWRTRAILQIRGKLAVAREVLRAAESQATMSQSQLSAARQRISDARVAIEEARVDERDARRALNADHNDNPSAAQQLREAESRERTGLRDALTPGGDVMRTSRELRNAAAVAAEARAIIAAGNAKLVALGASPMSIPAPSRTPSSSR